MPFPLDHLITEVSADLIDAGNDTHGVPSLIGFFNAGQRELVVLKPAANSKTTSLQLAAGKTKQAMPADALTLIKLTRNMGADGDTPGRAITLANGADLDLYQPTWHSDANAGGDVQQYVFDPLVPDTFYVYPKAPATAWHVEAAYSYAPAAVAAGGTCALLEVYREPLRHYVLSRAYARSAEVPAHGALAVAHYNQFMTLIGAKTAGEGVNDPNR